MTKQTGYNLDERGPDVADAGLIARAIAGEAAAHRAIIRAHNGRLFRVARGILRNDAEAEEALQEAYVSAFRGLRAFRGESTLSTWLTRIVVNEALGRLRKRRAADEASGPQSGLAEIIPFPGAAAPADPERDMAQKEILRFVERAIDALPDAFRTVFVARALEGLSVEEAADLLSLRPETVKTRLFRAREMLRERIDSEIGPVMLEAFPFAGARCERLTDAVLRRLELEA